MSDTVAVAVELWREIPGHPTYMVSTEGRVKSLARIVMRPHPKTGKPYEFQYRERMLMPSPMSAGYLTVNIGKGERYVHRMVLLAFVGPAPDGCEACHGNGDRTDNRLANLRWATPLANAEDREAHGTTARGMRSGNAKHPEEVVIAIRMGLIRQSEARRLFGMSAGHFQRIRTGQSRVLLAEDLRAAANRRAA